MSEEPKRCARKYTSYAEADKLLVNFVEEAETDSIWVSVDAQELTENRLGNEFCKIISMALDTAKATCILVGPPNDRFIRFRSREVQNQALIKIQYSCEGAPPGSDRELADLKSRIAKAGGYLKYQIDEDVGGINIAIPMKQTG